MDPAKLVENVYRRTKRQVSIVQEEEKKEENIEEPERKEDQERKEEGENDDNGDVNKMEYWHPKHYLDYAYAHPLPEVFSDENPNACSVM